jgi:phage/plasmid-like protein (TIGR03299 family)
LDWTVKKYPASITIPDTGVALGLNVKLKTVRTGRSAVVRETDNKILDMVSDDWKPVQNHEAFEFFHEFVMAGDMNMETAGSLKGGQIVWALAKVNESFELFGGDVVNAHLLFTNYHKYGFSTDVRFTPVRVVCNNTLSLSLSSRVEQMVKYSHRKVFKPEVVKEMLGITTAKLQKYKEMAAFLGSRRAKNEDVVEYFKRIFPMTTKTNDHSLSVNATGALNILNTQPGHQYAQGTWWQPFNSVTFMVDHVVGRTNDTRLTSSWYGVNKILKNKALELAVDMANKS